jgi:hypothetical protein
VADNLPLPATGKAATDKVTHSGDVDVDVQLIRHVHVTGAEGSKVPVDITTSGGIKISDAAGNTIGGITGLEDNRKVVTTAGDSVQLATSTPCKKVVIQAETNNTGVIVVGGTTVVAAQATRRGIALFPGDVYEEEIDNLADVYLDATVSGDGVTFNYST